MLLNSERPRYESGTSSFGKNRLLGIGLGVILGIAKVIVRSSNSHHSSDDYALQNALATQVPVAPPETLGPPLADQLLTLQEAGIAMLPGHAVDELVGQGSELAFQREPYEYALAKLGLAVPGSTPATYLSDDVFFPGQVFIADEGSLGAVVERLSVLADGALPVTNVRDHIDAEAGTGWVSFRLERRTIRWEVSVKDGALDASVLTSAAALLRERSAPVSLVRIDVGPAGDSVIVASTPEQLERLRTDGLRANPVE